MMYDFLDMFIGGGNSWAAYGGGASAAPSYSSEPSGGGASGYGAYGGAPPASGGKIYSVYFCRIHHDHDWTICVRFVIGDM